MSCRRMLAEMTNTYYEILQVEKSAPESEIKAAFKRLARFDTK